MTLHLLRFISQIYNWLKMRFCKWHNYEVRLRRPSYDNYGENVVLSLSCQNNNWGFGRNHDESPVKKCSRPAIHIYLLSLSQNCRSKQTVHHSHSESSNTPVWFIQYKTLSALVRQWKFIKSSWTWGSSAPMWRSRLNLFPPVILGSANMFLKHCLKCSLYFINIQRR